MVGVTVHGKATTQVDHPSVHRSSGKNPAIHADNHTPRHVSSCPIRMPSMRMSSLSSHTKLRPRGATGTVPSGCLRRPPVHRDHACPPTTHAAACSLQFPSQMLHANQSIGATPPPRHSGASSFPPRPCLSGSQCSLRRKGTYLSWDFLAACAPLHSTPSPQAQLVAVSHTAQPRWRWSRTCAVGPSAPLSIAAVTRGSKESEPQHKAKSTHCSTPTTDTPVPHTHHDC
jgi:hypothetical protein